MFQGNQQFNPLASSDLPHLNASSSLLIQAENINRKNTDAAYKK